MGFTTGFVGGLTLTTALLYLPISTHRQTRAQQSLLLRQQTAALKALVEPAQQQQQHHEPSPSPFDARWPREEGLVETLKDRWNREVQGVVTAVAGVDWSAVGYRAEVLVERAWGRMREWGS